MLIFLSGPDSYRRLEKLNEIVKSYRERQSGLSYERFDLGEEEGFSKFKNFAANRSIFDPVRLAVLDNPFDNDSSLKELKEVLKVNHKNKDLVILLNSLKKPGASFNALTKTPSQIQEFPALKAKELTAFIKKTATSYGLKLDKSMIDFLASAFGSDTWGLSTELERMALLSNQIHSLTAATRTRPPEDFYKLINTIKWGRRIEERLVALERALSERRDEPARIFNSLAYRLRDQREADTFADYDVAVKSGKLEYEEVLVDLALG